MKKQIINWYLGVSNWLKYIRSYKENKDNDNISDHKIMEQRKKIEKLKKEIEKYKLLENERANLLQLREKRIQELTNKYGVLKKQNKELSEVLFNAHERLEKKELECRSNIAKLGVKQKRINNLEKKIEKLNETHQQELNAKDKTIEFLKTHRKAPTLEELKAYEFQQKEVEKRMNQKTE